MTEDNISKLYTKLTSPDASLGNKSYFTPEALGGSLEAFSNNIKTAGNLEKLYTKLTSPDASLGNKSYFTPEALGGSIESFSSKILGEKKSLIGSESTNGSLPSQTPKPLVFTKTDAEKNSAIFNPFDETVKANVAAEQFSSENGLGGDLSKYLPGVNQPATSTDNLAVNKIPQGKSLVTGGTISPSGKSQQGIDLATKPGASKLEKEVGMNIAKGIGADEVGNKQMQIQRNKADDLAGVVYGTITKDANLSTFFNLPPNGLLTQREKGNLTPKLSNIQAVVDEYATKYNLDVNEKGWLYNGIKNRIESKPAMENAMLNARMATKEAVGIDPIAASYLRDKTIVKDNEKANKLLEETSTLTEIQVNEAKDELSGSIKSLTSKVQAGLQNQAKLIQEQLQRGEITQEVARASFEGIQKNAEQTYNKQKDEIIKGYTAKVKSQIIANEQSVKSRLQEIYTKNYTPEMASAMAVFNEKFNEEYQAETRKIANEQLLAYKNKYGALGQIGSSMYSGTGNVVRSLGGFMGSLGMQDANEGLRVAGEQMMADQKIPAMEMNWENMSDPAFWTTMGGQSIPYMIAVAGAVAATRSLGAGSLMASALTTTAATAVLESGGVYEDAIARGETTSVAGSKAAENFDDNMKLIGLNALMIAPFMGKIKGFGKVLAAEIFSEVPEEVWQQYSQQKAIDPTLKIEDFVASKEGAMTAVSALGLSIGLAGAAQLPAQLIRGKAGVQSYLETRALVKSIQQVGLNNTLASLQINNIAGELSAEDYAKVVAKTNQIAESIGALTDLTDASKYMAVGLDSKIKEMQSKLPKDTESPIYKAKEKQIKALQAELDKYVLGETEAMSVQVDGDEQPFPATEEQVKGMINDEETIAKVANGTLTINTAGDEKLLQEIDKKVQEYQKKVGAVLDPLSDMPTSTMQTIQRIEDGKPIDPIAIEEASNYLYEKYKYLSAMKKSGKRELTTEQIDTYMQNIGKDIEMIEKAKYPELSAEEVTVNIEENIGEPLIEQPIAGEKVVDNKPLPINQMAGESVTVNIGGENITGIIYVDEGGKATIESNNTIYEIPSEAEYVEYSSPIEVAETGINYLGQTYDDIRIETFNGVERAILVDTGVNGSKNSLKTITNPAIIEEIKYALALRELDTISDEDALQIIEEYETRTEKENPTATEKVPSGKNETNEDDEKLNKAIAEINLIEQIALEELTQSNGNTRLVEMKVGKDNKVYLVAKNADGSYSATLNGRNVKRPEILASLGELFNSQNEKDSKDLLVKLSAQTEALKTEVENKLFGVKPESEMTLGELYKYRILKMIKSDPEQYWSVDVPSDEDIEDAARNDRLVDVGGGMGIVTEDGNMIGMFKYDNSKSGVSKKVQAERIKLGGIKLDNFDGYLTREYIKNGFRVISRTPFNEEYAPEHWNEKVHGRPDVVAMIYDPDKKIDIEEKMFSDYGDMIQYRDDVLSENMSLLKGEKKPAEAEKKKRKRIEKPAEVKAPLIARENKVANPIEEEQPTVVPVIEEQKSKEVDKVEVTTKVPVKKADLAKSTLTPAEEKYLKAPNELSKAELKEVLDAKRARLKKVIADIEKGGLTQEESARKKASRAKLELIEEDLIARINKGVQQKEATKTDAIIEELETEKNSLRDDLKAIEEARKKKRQNLGFSAIESTEELRKRVAQDKEYLKKLIKYAAVSIQLGVVKSANQLRNLMKKELGLNFTDELKDELMLVYNQAKASIRAEEKTKNKDFKDAVDSVSEGKTSESFADYMKARYAGIKFGEKNIISITKDAIDYIKKKSIYGMSGVGVRNLLRSITPLLKSGDFNTFFTKVDEIIDKANDQQISFVDYMKNKFTKAGERNARNILKEAIAYINKQGLTNIKSLAIKSLMKQLYPLLRTGNFQAFFKGVDNIILKADFAKLLLDVRNSQKSLDPKKYGTISGLMSRLKQINVMILDESDIINFNSILAELNKKMPDIARLKGEIVNLLNAEYTALANGISPIVNGSFNVNAFSEAEILKNLEKLVDAQLITQDMADQKMRDELQRKANTTLADLLDKISDYATNKNKIKDLDEYIAIKSLVKKYNRLSAKIASMFDGFDEQFSIGEEFNNQISNRLTPELKKIIEDFKVEKINETLNTLVNARNYFISDIFKKSIGLPANIADVLSSRLAVIANVSRDILNELSIEQIAEFNYLIDQAMLGYISTDLMSMNVELGIASRKLTINSEYDAAIKSNKTFEQFAEETKKEDILNLLSTFNKNSLDRLIGLGDVNFYWNHIYGDFAIARSKMEYDTTRLTEDFNRADFNLSRGKALLISSIRKLLAGNSISDLKATIKALYDQLDYVSSIDDSVKDRNFIEYVVANKSKYTLGLNEQATKRVTKELAQYDKILDIIKAIDPNADLTSIDGVKALIDKLASTSGDIKSYMNSLRRVIDAFTPYAAVNAMSHNRQFVENEYYMPRLYISKVSDVERQAKAAYNSVLEGKEAYKQMKKVSSSSFERVGDGLSPRITDPAKLVQMHTRDVMMDYYFNDLITSSFKALGSISVTLLTDNPSKSKVIDAFKTSIQGMLFSDFVSDHSNTVFDSMLSAQTQMLIANVFRQPADLLGNDVRLVLSDGGAKGIAENLTVSIQDRLSAFNNNEYALSKSHKAAFELLERLGGDLLFVISEKSKSKKSITAQGEEIKGNNFLQVAFADRIATAQTYLSKFIGFFEQETGRKFDYNEYEKNPEVYFLDNYAAIKKSILLVDKYIGDTLMPKNPLTRAEKVNVFGMIGQKLGLSAQDRKAFFMKALFNLTSFNSNDSQVMLSMISEMISDPSRKGMWQLSKKISGSVLSNAVYMSIMQLTIGVIAAAFRGDGDDEDLLTREKKAFEEFTKLFTTREGAIGLSAGSVVTMITGKYSKMVSTLGSVIVHLYKTSGSKDAKKARIEAAKKVTDAAKNGKFYINTYSPNTPIGLVASTELVGAFLGLNYISAAILSDANDLLTTGEGSMDASEKTKVAVHLSNTAAMLVLGQNSYAFAGSIQKITDIMVRDIRKNITQEKKDKAAASKSKTKRGSSRSGGSRGSSRGN